MRKTILEGLDSINGSLEYSEKQINTVREGLQRSINNDNVCVVTVGSYARGEASDESDIDCFIIYDDEYVDEKSAEEISNTVRLFIESIPIKMPSKGGAFDSIVKRREFLENIGGNSDTNKSLTRRMLYLLECEWLTNEEFYNKLTTDIIKTYVKNTITQHTMCRFFLNDLIRYYRTMCVDFEYKTCEASKSWGDRNIKLLFSRKLIYFSGLITVAETAQHLCASKRKVLNEYLSLRPIDRIGTICGGKSHKAFKMYNEFLQEMSKQSVRKILNNTDNDRNKQDEVFRDLKNKGHHFSWELARLLNATYDVSHPIHLAIKF